MRQNQAGELIKEYIKTASEQRNGKSNLSPDTRAMAGLIKVLNEIDTPIAIKDQFMKELELGIYDPKIDDTAAIGAKDFKFKKEDFKKFISEIDLNTAANKIENQDKSISRTK